MSAIAFQAQLADIAEERIPKMLSRAVRATGMNIYGTLIDNPQNGGTPIRTGYARASWNISTGQPEGHLPAEARDPNGTYSPQPMKDPGSDDKVEDVFITNAVPYIIPLNQGHSKQQPAMFIERAFERATGVRLEKV